MGWLEQAYKDTEAESNRKSSQHFLLMIEMIVEAITSVPVKQQARKAEDFRIGLSSSFSMVHSRYVNHVKIKLVPQASIWREFQILNIE